MIEVARALDERPHAVVVWNGEEGDGPGGTSDLVAALRRLSDAERLTVIDPTPPSDCPQVNRPFSGAQASSNST
jgi:hypothetical protein